MKITNRTAYDTKALRWLIEEVHRRTAQARGRLKTWPYLHVTVAGNRAGHYTGHASYSGYAMVLRIPQANADPVRTVWLIRHELLHNYGQRHRNYRPIDRDFFHDGDTRFTWAADRFGTTLPLKPVRPKPNLKGEREQRARELLSQWERKLAIAHRRVKKYRAKVHYYERLAAAVKATGPVGNEPVPGQTTLFPEKGGTR